MLSALEAGGQHDAQAPGRPAGAFSLSELLDLLLRRKLLVAASAGACLLLALAYLAAQTPVYRASAELLVDPQALQVVGKDIVRTDTSASIDFANVDSQALVMVSSGVLRQVIDELDLEDDPAFSPAAGFLARHFGRLLQPTPEQRAAATMDALRRAIVIQRVDNSLVFRIFVSHPDAKKAADIANALASAYFRQGNEGRRGAVERANASLIGQIAGLRTQLNDAETAVQSFRAKSGLVSTGEGGLIVSQQLRDLYGQIGQVTAELARQQARRDQLARFNTSTPLSDNLPEALSSTAMTSLRAQYAQSAREAASLSQTLAPQHPRLVEIRAELAETRRLLAAELSRIRSSVQEAYRQAEANLANLQKRAQELTRSQETSGAAQIRLRQLESEAEAIRVVYNASLQRAKELEQQKKIETNNSRLLSEAVPPAIAAKPPAAIVLAAALLFGSCLGLGIAYLLEMLPRFPGLRLPRAQAKTRAAAEPTPQSKPQPMTPELAGEVLGVASVTRLPAARPQREAALVPAAMLLQKALGQHLPASIVIAGMLDDTTQAELAEHLGQALAKLGESVLICHEGAGRKDMSIRRIEPVAVPGGAASSTRRRNFIIMQRPTAGSGKTVSAPPDAVVLTLDPTGMTSQQLLDMATAIDPSGERILAVITPEARANSSINGGVRGLAARLLRRETRSAA